MRIWNNFGNVLLIIIVLLSGCAQNDAEYETKKDALRKIDKLIENADFHEGGLKKIKGHLKNSEHNIELIVQIADYVATVTYETETLVRLAEIASKCDSTCLDLERIVELPILNVGRSAEVIKLAEFTMNAKTVEDKIIIDNEIQRLKTYAKYSSLEEALEQRR